MKVISSISWFVASVKDVEFIREFIEAYHFNVQVGFYEKKDLALVERFIDFPTEYISSVHLPKGLNLGDYKHSNGIVSTLRSTFGVDLFVVHPWADDLDKIVDFVNEAEQFCLCLEIFPSRKRRQGSPFQLLADYGRILKEDYVGLCADFSHIDDELTGYTFLKGLLPYTKMIHASSRIGRVGHVPLFKKNSVINGVNLLGQLLDVKDLKVREIVLEYNKEYHKDLTKHIFWLVEWVNRKRKRWGGADASKA